MPYGKVSVIYNEGYMEGYKEGMNAALAQIIKQEQLRTNVIIQISAKEIDEITETDKDLQDALNTVNNYKKMLFGE